MNITIQLEREHSFQNQIRRNFILRKGTSLTGDLRLFASTWPFGICDHEHAGKLGVEFTFSDGGKKWMYCGLIDCRLLWPAPGASIIPSTEADSIGVGPLLGMRDDREDFYYLLPDGTERWIRLKYVGFECWVSCVGEVLKINLRHFSPDDYYVVISYSMPVEDVLFHKQAKLSYDAEGFLEDMPHVHPFVRVDECAP